ncbi:hypothetical protein DFH06DRAFT_941406, partial [Mycena polygramma]
SPPLSAAAAAALSKNGSVNQGSTESPANPPRATEDAAPNFEQVPPCPAKADWVTEVYPQVSAKNLGASYNELLAAWVGLEGIFKFEKTPTSVRAVWNAKSANRPPAVDKWVSAGRGMRGGPFSNGVGPAIGDADAFDAVWWRWWAAIQPKWRSKDSGRPGRFVRNDYPDATETNWATMRHPGPNGMLSFVATLYWWGMAVAERGDKESWSEAVEEVKWMMKGLL